MVKISANIIEQDAEAIKRLAKMRNWKQSDVIRQAIHQYCLQLDPQSDERNEMLRETQGVFKTKPMDADAIRKESNCSSRI